MYSTPGVPSTLDHRLADIFRSKKHAVPIASLQMLWGKMYTIWDPYLAQSALRAKTASFEPFESDFSQKTIGLSKAAAAKTTQPGVLPGLNEVIHVSLRPSSVHAMNVQALTFISRTLDHIGREGIEAPNLYLWLRDLITMATTRALYGKENPFEKDPKLSQLHWCILSLPSQA